MLLNKLEDIEHARLRAVVQVLVDKEKGVEAFEDYMKIAFPYLEGRKRKQREDARKELLAWVREGPMKVTPMQQENRVRSRLKEKVVNRMNSPEQQQRHASMVNQWNKQQGQ